ncbi:MAG: malto-oligosyltrehalose synthase [Bacteroidales bacterium]
MNDHRRSAHVPISTYRLQFHRDFTFADAERVVPYLHDLGAGDCYSSPYLMARPGSRHGYDITDHGRLNNEIGSEDDYRRFVAALAARGMGQLLDFVPNHMGVDPLANRWWRDVLENGPSSLYGRFFDIDWDPVKPELRGKVLLPILGDQYGIVLERGELRLGFSDGMLHLSYFDHNLPINPRRSVAVYEWDVRHLVAELGEDTAEVREFLSIMTELRNLPDYHETDPERIAERHREKLVARDRLARLVAESPRIRAHIDGAVKAFNGNPGEPHSFDALHALLEEQPYRLAYWRTASHEINYRRFFDINDLAGIRMEDPEVFEATHALVRRLIAEGGVTGLRIDHPDGLYGPGEYFRKLQEMAARDGDATPLYVVAEKILSPGERLPDGWPIQGTTGYNFANELNGLFIDPAGARPLRRIYRRITGQLSAFDEVAYACKKLITETSLASELNVLAHALNRLSEAHRRSRDFTLTSLHDALAEVVACFPVYRTYVNRDGWSPSDRRVIEAAVRRARRRNPALEASAWDFLREVLLPRKAEAGEPDADGEFDRRVSYPPPDAEEYAERLHFAMRFQQYTAPVQAKGVEDTAFYRYNLLVSLNEVGGDPGRFGVSVAQFHEQNMARLTRWPLEMTATATHDTKLGEDVRARVNVLSELVDEWRRVLARWMRINAANRTEVDGEAAPDRNDEYRFYQVVLGSWPVEGLDDRAAVTRAPDEYVARLREYMTKAIKEAKVRTSWVNDNEAYDAAVVRFVERSLAGPGAPRFFNAFLPFARRVAHLGMLGSLSQLALKIASPGVPDFYQGTDLWDLHLVDPDNRRAVDYTHRAALLDRIRPVLVRDPELDTPEGDDQQRLSAVREMLACWADGRIKLFLTATGLRTRRAKPDLFLFGDYVPLEADLRVPGSVVALARRSGDDALIVVAPRLVAKLVDLEMPVGETWKESRLPLPGMLAGTYRNLLTGEQVRSTPGGLRLDEALRHCPVAQQQRDRRG